MSGVKRVICLANSKKEKKTCFAGRALVESSFREWVRPVASVEGDAISPSEQQLSDGTAPHLLDIVDIGLVKPVAIGCQTENWLLDKGYRWSRVRRASSDELVRYVDHPDTLWTNGHSTKKGVNDEMPIDVADTHVYSLQLIRPNRVAIHVLPSLRVQADFEYREVHYRMWVTDRVVEEGFNRKGEGVYRLADSLLTVSISKPFKKDIDHKWYRYKLVAAVIGIGDNRWAG